MRSTLLFLALLALLFLSASALKLRGSSALEAVSDSDSDIDVEVDVATEHEAAAESESVSEVDVEHEQHVEAVAEVAGAPNTPLIPYSTTASKYLFDISAATYCNVPALQGWSCNFCQGVSGFAVETVVHNAAHSMDVVIGRSPAMNNVFGRPVIIVAFKGTDPKVLQSTLNNVKADSVSVPYCQGCKAHRGFYEAYASVQPDVEKALAKLVQLMVPGAPIIVTGYSLGAAVASVAGGAFLANGLGAKNQVIIWNFGSPRVGNSVLSQWVTASTRGNYYRVTHYQDIITRLPPSIMQFTHAGTEFWYNKDSSAFKTCALPDDETCSAGGLPNLDINIHLTYFEVPFAKMVDDLSCRNSKGNAGALIPQLTPYDHAMASYFMWFCGVTYCDQSLIKTWQCNYCQDARLKTFKITNSFYDAKTMQLAYAGVETGSNNPTKGPFILVAFKGTTAKAMRSWFQDLKMQPVDPMYKGCSNCRVHEGFFGCYKAVAAQISAEVKLLQKQYPTYPVYMVGQSLGAAVVHVAALDFIAVQGIKPKMVYNFGSPRVGNLEFDRYFTNALTSAKTTFYRVVNYADPVVHVPPPQFGFVHSSPEVYYNKAGAFQICLAEDALCSGSIKPPEYNWFDHLAYVGDKQADMVQDKKCNP